MEKKFRGKRPYGKGGWVVGYLVSGGLFGGDENTCWIFYDKHFVEVIPETIGQQVPIKDANGHILFEGDILSGQRIIDNFHIVRADSRCTEYRIVEYSNSETKSEFALPKYISYSERLPENNILWELVGNKWDNPELIQSL